MRRRFSPRRVRRKTAWADGLSVVHAELPLGPLNGSTTLGATYGTSISFTSASVLAQHGGEGMVVARLLGSITPHFCTQTQDDTDNEAMVVLRWGFARIPRFATGITGVVPDFFSNGDLGSEDIMYMREHIVLPLFSDTFNGVGLPDDRRLFHPGAPVTQPFPLPRARYAEFGFDVGAKRRVDENQDIMLLLQGRILGSSPPDPTVIKLAWTAWIRMLVLRPVR